MTRTECATLLAYVTAAVPQVAIPAQTAEVWWDLLGDLPYAVATQAVRQVLARQRGHWWPSIGEIRETAIALQHPDWPSVDQAWGQVRGAVHRYGYYQPDAALATLDSLVREVVEAIGWTEICAADPDVLRGQFARYYQAARSRHTDAALTAGLTASRAVPQLGPDSPVGSAHA
jgi:hypothetical protein